MLNKELAQFVPARVCLACDGCCRFHDGGSVWRPKITGDEIKRLYPDKLDVANAVLDQKAVDDNGYFKTVNVDGACCCAFFDAKYHTCKIYSERPFECALYPFLLVKKEKRIFLGVHLSCPYIQEKHSSEEYKRYVETLKEFFQAKNVVEFVQRNQTLAGTYLKYLDEIEDLFFLY